MMNAYRTLGILLSSSILALAACGTSVLGGGTGADGTGAGGTGEGGASMGGSGTGSDPRICNGQVTPLSCEQTGCPSGYACVKDPDPTSTCHPSDCGCSAEGWVCTADCGLNGSSCVPTTAGLCNGVPNPESCTATSCPAGWTCTPDPDPTACYSSICDCTAQGWACTDDCMMNGSKCVKGL